MNSHLNEWFLLIFCRCNNILYIRGIDEEEEGEMKEWPCTLYLVQYKRWSD